VDIRLEPDGRQRLARPIPPEHRRGPSLDTDQPWLAVWFEEGTGLTVGLLSGADVADWSRLTAG
jgi:hypothetical protein